MLVPVTVMPVIFEQLVSVPEGTSDVAGPACALTTPRLCGRNHAQSTWIAASMGANHRCGSGVAGGVSIWSVRNGNELQLLRGSAFRELNGPGLISNSDQSFWGLLPGFLFVAAVCTTQTISGSVAIQRVSWNTPRGGRLSSRAGQCC